MSITYNDIKKANGTIKTTDIKGKQYADVNQRIKAFRMLYPQGFIFPEMVSNENGVCIFRTTVGFYDEKGEANTLAVGTAYEKEGSTFINKTSYIENCETSSVGRALGMAGFGIDTSVASAEEVQNAITNQAANEKIDELKVRALTKQLQEAGVDFSKVNELYKVKGLQDLTIRQYMNIQQHFSELIDRCRMTS